MFGDRNITAANTQGATINSGVLTVLGTMKNDNLMISCVVVHIGSGTSNTVATSNTSVLRVQGKCSAECREGHMGRGGHDGGRGT